MPTPADIEAMLPPVRGLVHREFNNVPPHIAEPRELVQVGMVAIIQAARRYDPAKGASFPTYATFRARGAIIDYLRQQTPGSRSIHGPLTITSLDEPGHDHLAGYQTEDHHGDPWAARTLEAALQELTDGERHAIVLTIQAELTQEQAAACMAVSPSRVSQLVKAGLAKLAARADIQELAA